MKIENCGLCRFFLDTDNVCRRYPPLAEIVKIEGDTFTCRSFFPAMRPDAGWCGEFQRRDS